MNLASAMEAEVGVALIGVYLHGSAVLGGFHPAASDADVLAVIAEPADAVVQARMGARLAAAGGCPGSGLEMSVINAATDPGMCRFEAHVSTGLDPKMQRSCWPAGRGLEDHPGRGGGMAVTVCQRHHASGCAGLLIGPAARGVDVMVAEIVTRRHLPRYNEFVG
jgi:hypothetical protein